MSIDYTRYFQELDNAKRLVREALNDLQPQLCQQGFNVPPFLVHLNPHNLYLPRYCGYASGKFFFERAYDEIEKSLDLFDSLTTALIVSQNVPSQRCFDEISLRQRKLFELMLITIMFSRANIYAPLGTGVNASPNPALYYLDYHLSQEREYLQLRYKDLVRYFGSTCASTKRQIAQRLKIESDLRSVHQIDATLCTWNRDIRAQFENVMPIATPLEKTALGFGYQHVFGAASSQIHLNMSNFYNAKSEESEFLKRIDNLMLLIVSNVLRFTQISDLAQYVLGQNCIALRQEFTGQFPNKYVSAALGAASTRDIVAVFEAPDFFLGKIGHSNGGGGSITEANAQNAIRAEKEASQATISAGHNLAEATAIAQTEATRTAQEAVQANTRATDSAARLASLIAIAGNQQAEADRMATIAAEATTAATSAQMAVGSSAEYVSYDIKPITSIGRSGAFTDAETMVIVRVADIPTVLQQSVAAGFITQEMVNDDEDSALKEVIKSDAARNQLILPRMNAANMPDLYFVQRYLSR